MAILAAMRLLLAILACCLTVAAGDLYESLRSFGPKYAVAPFHCAFSPDGKWVAMVQRRLSVWDFESNKIVWDWKTDKKVGLCGRYRVAFSADSMRVATFSEKGYVVVRLGTEGWAIERVTGLDGTRTRYRSTSTPPQPFAAASDVMSAAFLLGIIHPEGRYEHRLVRVGVKLVRVVGLPDGRVAYGDASFTTQILGKRPRRQRLKGLLLEASPDGSLWLVATNPARFKTKHADLAILEAPSGKQLKRFRVAGKEPYPLKHASFSPDGKILATAEGNGEIVLRDARTAKRLQRIKVYKKKGMPLCVAFSPDGEYLLIAGRGLGGVQLWRRKLLK